MPQILLMKAEYLVLLSFLLTFAVITNAFYIKRQFYPSVIYLTKSSASIAILYIQAFVFVILFGKLFQRIFLGQLRAIEREHLYDRSWFSLTETCLAFTVFRDDFSPHFVALFAVLLFLKCFHWLLEDRVDYMEQSPVLGPIFHARITSLLSVLFFVDSLFISFAYLHIISKGASVQIVFGFEYAILLVSVISCVIKYILHSIEIRTGEQWENKSVFMLYSDLILGFFRLILYVMFIIVMMKMQTFPLFSIRPMSIAMRALYKSCNDVLESRRAIQNLNTLYPDLTDDELANVVDTTCIICREEMQVQQSIKRLSCQHVFHKNCLRSWFQRQQTCPICRTTVLRPTTPRTAPSYVPPAGFNPPPSASSAPVNSTNTQISPPNINVGTIPMVLPPFAFPPPPLPPVNLTGMSEESIRAMEGTELSHVKARIQCLRNVRILLDASMTQMQQYMNIVSTQSNMENGTRLVNNLNTDLDQVLPQSINGEDNNDRIRHRRLEYYTNRLSPSTTDQNNDS